VSFLFPPEGAAALTRIVGFRAEPISLRNLRSTGGQQASDETYRSPELSTFLSSLR
jgi:hypothetical protein